MSYKISDLYDFPVGTRIRGYVFECENCTEPCIGSKATRFCCPACRIEAYRYRELRAEIAAVNAEIAAEDAQRAAEDAEIIARDAQRDLDLLLWLAPGTKTAAEAAEYISATMAADDIPELNEILDDLARLVWRHGFFIRKHQDAVTCNDDLVEVRL